MDLKDKLISSYSTLEAQGAEDENLAKLRQDALEVFKAKGFPTKREETWKYTSLKPVLKEDYSLLPKTASTLTAEDISAHLISDLETYNLVFVDGVYAKALSSPATDSFTAMELSAARKDKDLAPIVAKHFNTIAPTDKSLNALNTAFSKEGVFIHLKKSVVADKPVQVLYFSTGSEQAMMLHPRNLVVAEANAQVKIIERHQSLAENPVLTNSVTEISVAKDAFVDYYKIQNDHRSASLIDNTYAVQGDNSNCTIHTFAFGGKLIRNNVKVFQKGEHIDSTLKGVTLLNEKQHVDHNTFVHHMQPNCESHQDYKGVFDDKSVGVFDGYILVDKIAQQTDGYQNSNNLLLSDRATINAKPQLEIYADDVKCSHGCTVGQMDKEALFYLKSRGIPEKEARALMMYAFSSSVLDSVKIPQLKERIDQQIAQKLGVNLGFEL